MWRLRLQCDVEPMLEPAGEDPVWIFVVDPEPGGGWTSLLLFLMVMEEYEIKARMFDELARNMCFLLGMSSFFHLLYVYE